MLSPERAQTMSSRGRGSIDPAGGQQYTAAAVWLFHAANPFRRVAVVVGQQRAGSPPAQKTEVTATS